MNAAQFITLCLQWKRFLFCLQHRRSTCTTKREHQMAVNLAKIAALGPSTEFQLALGEPLSAWCGG